MLKVYCAHPNKFPISVRTNDADTTIIHAKYRCPSCRQDWQSFEPQPLIVIGYVEETK